MGKTGGGWKGKKMQKGSWWVELGYAEDEEGKGRKGVMGTRRNAREEKQRVRAKNIRGRDRELGVFGHSWNHANKKEEHAGLTEENWEKKKVARKGKKKTCREENR